MAIVGGGIGGLALALALSRKSIACTVFETDPDFATRRQGYGFTLQQGASLGSTFPSGEHTYAAY